MKAVTAYSILAEAGEVKKAGGRRREAGGRRR
jgi:hypothetical protein